MGITDDACSSTLPTVALTCNRNCDRILDPNPNCNREAKRVVIKIIQAAAENEEVPFLSLNDNADSNCTDSLDPLHDFNSVSSSHVMASRMFSCSDAISVAPGLFSRLTPPLITSNPSM